jgi:hypothetical protein
MGKNLVRNTLVASALAVPMAAIITDAAIAGKDNFIVRNDSRVPITQLYVSASSRPTWDNDILEGDWLEYGEQTRIVFGDPSPNNCLYDILAVFSDGQTVEDYQVNVCSNTGYTFYDE